MIWLLALGLLVFVFLLQARVARLEQRLADLADMVDAARHPAPDVIRREAAAFDGPEESASPAAAVEPEAAVDETWAIAAQPEPEPAPVLVAARPEPASAPRPRAAASTAPLSTWLAENGLAWLGGGALALGGLFLVVYAAQRGVFTPTLRIIAAILVGGLMLFASEAIRRQKAAPGGRHLLASGATAGAGGATLYGAFWAAHNLYALIPFELAAALVVATSLGLLAYALLQGEALAILALAGAFAAPVITDQGSWVPYALTAYLTVIVLTGFAFSGLRRWPAAGYASLAGAFLWSLSASGPGPLGRTTLILLAAAAAATGAVWLRRSRGKDEPAAFDAFAALPTAAVALASLLSIPIWISEVGRLHGARLAALLSVGLGGLAALAAARRLAPAALFAVPVGAAFLGLCAAAPFAAKLHPAARAFPLILLPLSMAAIGLVAGLLAPQRRTPLLAIGGIGAALLATIAWPVLEQAGYPNAWVPAAGIAVLMILAAWPIARATPTPATDRALALWLAGAVELVFLAIFAAMAPAWAPAAQAFAALALAAAASRLGWRGLPQGAVAGGLVAFASLLRPAFVAGVLDGAIATGQVALVASLAAALVLTSAWLLGSRGSRAAEAKREVEALGSAALLIGLMGAFLVIQRWTAVESDAIGEHLGASLRTVLILAAAMMLALRARAEDGWVSRWRLYALLALGVVHGLIWQFGLFNPWWGLGEAPLGPPVFNSLLVSYLLPAGLLLAVFRRRPYGALQLAGAVGVAALAFLVAWAVMGVRHAVHPDMAGGVGRVESCAYALIALAVAAALVTLRGRAGDAAAASPSAWLTALGLPAGWIALAWSVLTFWIYASPWWGPISGPLHSPAAAAALFGAYGAAALLAVAMFHRAARQDGAGVLPQAAVSVAVGHLFVLLTLLIRCSFRGLAMGPSAREARVETWTYSAAWALFGLAVLLVGGARRNFTLRWLGLIVLLGTLMKVLVFDMARLDGVVRAASFLAVGALLLIGAVAARRLNAGALLFARKREAANPA